MLYPDVKIITRLTLNYQEPALEQDFWIHLLERGLLYVAAVSVWQKRLSTSRKNTI